MYKTGLSTEFNARHFLTGGDWGTENFPHTHHYRLEVEISGNNLDEHGFLIDLLDLELVLTGLVQRFQEGILNEQVEFLGLNPSLENFSRVLGDALIQQFNTQPYSEIGVRLWESERAWAEFRWFDRENL